jgi:N-acetylmuramoyl-L-alanine amidase
MKKLSNINTIILDRGHATLDKDGKYITPGKQYVFKDGLHVYEGYENQRYVERLEHYARRAGLNVLHTVLPYNPYDPSLLFRVNYANDLHNKANCLFLSVHNNAGKGQGTEVFTSIGQTNSDLFAESITASIAEQFPKRKLRLDTSDGDKDKESNFYVLKNTHMPAVLMEYGFFDNREDYEWLSNPCNIELMAKATIEGIKNAINTK